MDLVDSGEGHRLAHVEAVTDQLIEGLTIGAEVGAGKHELPIMVDVRLDRTLKLGYNKHVVMARSEGSAWQRPLERALLFSLWDNDSIRDSSGKAKAALDGRPTT